MEYKSKLNLQHIWLPFFSCQGLFYVQQVTLSMSLIPIRNKMFFRGWLSLILWIFLELIFVLWFLVSVSELKGTFFLVRYFFPMTAHWVISKALFYRFWLLHLTVFITEFHLIFSPCWATVFLTEKRAHVGTRQLLTCLTWNEIFNISISSASDLPFFPVRAATPGLP